jgi:peptidoglycan/xylan/chitin deacetylase (PgdA/CDA1 family)
MELGGSLKPSLVIIFVVLFGTSGCLGSDVSLANWPDGHESAVVISFDVEQAQAADLQRLIILLEKYNAKATFFVVAGYYEGAEDTLEPLRDYEVASKGWDQGEWAESYEEQRDSIKRSHDMLSSLGFNPAGFRAPFLMNNQETFAVLSDLGYLYDSSDNGMLPTLHGEIVEIPLSIAYDPFWKDFLRFTRSLKGLTRDGKPF